MPLSFATMCGSMPYSKKALMMALVMASWPQPAQSVDSPPL